ncbi:MAG TPA: rhomboid family intramembrane serine protease [Candidatus Dormibacteraeota bacterium]|nr:rhomboid family intramembrane serine protease [Candidatus Dormibacteraeota bacterium]
MQPQRNGRIRDSPSVQMSCVLIIIYLITGIVGGNLLSLNYDMFYLLAQVNELVWHGAVWMLITSLFLHANPAHIGGNVLFLLIFGTSLEEQVSRRNWLVTYFLSGIVGNIAFLLLGGNSIGVGASGAIWGLLAAAGGWKGLVGMIFYIGLNLFAGGGFLAHAGGLVAGLVLRHFWLRPTIPAN